MIRGTLGNGYVRLGFDHPVMDALSDKTKVCKSETPQYMKRGWSCDPYSERTKRLFSAAGAAVRCGRNDIAVELLEEIDVPPDAPADWTNRR